MYGEIVAIFFGLILGMETPLLAIHLLWINLVTDSFPAISLGLEPCDKGIMYKKPKNSKHGIFSGGLWGKIIFEGSMIGILTLIAFDLGVRFYGIEVGRTMAFASLSLLELLHGVNIRSEESIFEIGVFKNKYMVIAIILGVILQVTVIAVPSIAEIFKVVSLNIVQWLYVGLIAITPIVVMEFKKKFRDMKYGKRVYVGQKSRI